MAPVFPEGQVRSEGGVIAASEVPHHEAIEDYKVEQVREVLQEVIKQLQASKEKPDTPRFAITAIELKLKSSTS